MTRSERWLLALAVVVATGTLAANLGSTDLWPPNEPRVAEISREMRDGGWWVPQLNGVPFLEEPPLFYWLQAAMYRVAGEPSAFAARVPAAGGAIVGVLATIGLARAVGANAGVAALVLATAPEYWWMARTGTPDTANAAATALALVALYAAWQSGSMPMLAVAAGSAALAFWLKSFLGVGLAAAVAVGFLALAGRGRLRRRLIAGGAVLVAVAAASWLLLLWRSSGAGAVSFFVVTNHLGRLVDLRPQGHVRPFYYYVPNLALDLLPWSVALPAAFVSAWTGRRDGRRLFPLLWAGLILALLSASAVKTAHYALPAYPALAVLIAQWWSRTPEGRLDRITWTALGAVLVVGVPVVTIVATSLDPAAVTGTLAAHGHRAATAARIVLDARPGGLSWCAVPVFLAGTAFALARRAGRPVLAAVAAATAGMIVHVLITLGVLPAFDHIASARPIGEAIGRVATDGVDVFTYGFDNPEAVSPFMFYARRTLPVVGSEDALEERLLRRRACAVVPADAHARLAAPLRGLPTTRRTVGELEIVLVSSRRGGCPTVD